MNPDLPDILRPDREPVDLHRLRRISNLERRLFDTVAEWPKSDHPAFVETLRAVASSIETAGGGTDDETDRGAVDFYEIGSETPAYSSLFFLSKKGGYLKADRTGKIGKRNSTREV